MILGNIEQQLNQAEESFAKIVDFVRKNQPERIEMKNIRLQNQRLKNILEQTPDAISSNQSERIRMLSIKFEQLMTEFDYAKASRISKGDFLAKLRRILDIRQNDNSASQIRTLDSRPPQQLNSSQHSSSSAGGIGKLKYGNSKGSQQNMYRVPSVANQSMYNADTGNFGKKDSIGEKQRNSYKNPLDSKDMISSSNAPRLTNPHPISYNINTEISQIKMVPNNYEINSGYFHSGLVQPIASVQTIQPMKEAIDRMISPQVPQTPVSGLNELKDFPRPETQQYTQGFTQGFGGPYFPVGVDPQLKQIKSSHSIRSQHSKHSRNEKGMLSDPQAFLSYQQQNVYKKNIQNLFKKAEILKQDNTFRSQMRSPSQSSKSKSKSKSQMRSTQRIRDLASKQELISRLAAENLELRKQLDQNNGRMRESQEKKQTFPEGTLEFQKYVISNQLLKQENQQIYSKLKQLEEVLEQLSKENFYYKGYGQSNVATYKNQQKFQSEHTPNSPHRHPTQQIQYTHKHQHAQMRIVGPKHPLIQLPPELGQLIDTQTHRSSPIIQYEQRQVHYFGQYQGPIGRLDRSERSLQNHFPPPTYLPEQPQPPSMLPSSITAKMNALSQSPKFRRDTQYEHGSAGHKNSYSQKDFPQANPIFYKRNSSYSAADQSRGENYNNIPPANNTNNDASSQKYYTANNISASGDASRYQNQGNKKKDEYSYRQRDQRDVFDQNRQADSSGRQYQDFPKISNAVNEGQNISSPLSPILNGQSIEKSFQTFKILPQSQRNIQNQNNIIYKNQIEQPYNFYSKNRSSLLRNKVAFYKKSLILIKDDPNFQLAFKRSDISRQLNTVRIIFYVNNKQQYPQTVNFKYQYDQNLYTIKHGDRVSNIPQMSQGRQQLIVRINDIYDVSSQFIVCHLTVGMTSVDLVLPVFFFKFEAGVPSPASKQTMVIQPDKQFSPQFLSTLIPMIHKNPEEYLEFMKGEKSYRGQCSIQTIQGQEGIGLQWMSGALRISAPLRYINMIAWSLSSDI